MNTRPLPILTIALTLTIAAGCARREPAGGLQSRAARGGNVLLVTIDTLRRDRLGAYGSDRGLTPALDRIAASGLRYAHAYSHVPMTLPAHTSILTGRVPRRHGVHDNGSFRLDDGVPTLASVLKQAGYRTGAFVGAFVLDARFGLNRGFDEYDDRYPHVSEASTFSFAERRAADVVRAAGDWILGAASAVQSPAGAPWFAWVHCFDPHAPYEAPVEYRSGRSPYDAEVAYTDAMLGQLLDRLSAAHALDHTLVVVTADHGESLGEHGEATHGLFAYDATLAVPLLVSGPAVPRGVVDGLVAHADLLPTIVDLVGVPAPANLDGRSLVRPPAAERLVTFEALDANLTRDWAPLTGIVAGRWKYIELPLPELYDLAVDPAEERNLAERDQAHRDALARTLARLTAPGPDRGPDRGQPGGRTGDSPGTARGQAPVVDDEAAARLRSLGYVAPSVTFPGRTYTDADDPKRLVALNERFNSALAAFNAGRADEALSQFQALLRARPDFVAARTSAATVLVAQHRARDAVVLLRDAPSNQAASSDILVKLGMALHEAGDLNGAAATLERARAAGSQNPELLNDLGVVYAQLGRPADARPLLLELLQRDPNAAGTWNNLGLLELAAGRQDAAIAAFRHAIQADPANGDAWQGLGAAAVEHDRGTAIDAWKRAERLRPRDYDLLFNLGMVLAESDRPADALPYLLRFAREAPRDRYAGDLPRVDAAIQKARR